MIVPHLCRMSFNIGTTFPGLMTQSPEAAGCLAWKPEAFKSDSVGPRVSKNRRTRGSCPEPYLCLQADDDRWLPPGACLEEVLGSQCKWELLPQSRKEPSGTSKADMYWGQPLHLLRPLYSTTLQCSDGNFDLLVHSTCALQWEGNSEGGGEEKTVYMSMLALK
jgi:hypothetical protein